MCRVLICFVLFIGLGARADASSEPLKFNVSIDPEFSAYLDSLLTAPAYAVIALENSGFQLSISTPPILESRTHFQVGPAKVKFLERIDKIFHYSIDLALPLGLEIGILVDFDTSEITNGRLIINASQALLSLIPEELILRVQTKLEFLTSPLAQKKLISYIDNLNTNNSTEPLATSKLFDQFAFDLYNHFGRSSVTTVDSVASETTIIRYYSEKLSYFLAILIWIVGFPLYLLVLRRKINKKIVNHS